MKTKKNIIFLQEILNNSLIKIILALSFVYIFYAITIGFSSPINDYFGSLLLVLGTNKYFVFIYLCFFLILTYTIYEFFKKNDLNIIRNENKKKYHKTLYNKVFSTNNLFFTIFVVSTIIILIIFRGQNIQIAKMSSFGMYNYAISNIQYLVYVIFKYYFLCQFFSFLNLFLFMLIDKKIVILFNIIIYGLILGTSLNLEPVSNILMLPLSPGSYIQLIPYNSFYLEISCFFVYIFSLSIILAIVYLFVCKSRKGVCE